MPRIFPDQHKTEDPKQRSQNKHQQFENSPDRTGPFQPGLQFPGKNRIMLLQFHDPSAAQTVKCLKSSENDNE